MLLTLAMTLMASALPAAACRNNFVFSKYGICSAATREDMVIGYWQAKTESGISNLEVNPPRLIRFREYRRGFQTPHGHSPMPATLGRNGYLTTDTAQTQ